MDDETRILIDKIGIVGGFVLMLLALLGEVLGWWNDVGIILGAVGLAWSLVSALDVNGREAVLILRPMPMVLEQLGAGQTSLRDQQGTMLDKQDTMVELQRATLAVDGKVLTIQERILERQDATVVALDRITDILDERLGV